MLKSILINISCAALAVLANALLKQSLQGRLSWKGSVPTLLWDSLTMLQYPLVWLGAAAFIAANLLWLFILATQRMSVAYPLQLSLVILISFLVSISFFSESISVRSCAGLAFLLVGITLIAR
jgi:multidrug transporter EmrE-like cation transporter